MILSLRTKNYDLFDRLYPHLSFENDDEKLYFQYKAFKEVALRNDKNGLQRVVKVYPSVIDTLTKTQKYRNNISKSMF